MTDTSPLAPASGTPPEQLVFDALYAPLNVDEMLASASSRSRIRRLPAAQLYYSLQSAGDADLEQLLAHLTEEQWRTIVDLDIWDRDETTPGQILHWARFLSSADPAVARKLLRATDADLLELLFNGELEIYARTEEDEFEGEPAEGRSWMQTRDGQFLLVLPEQPEKERLLRGLLERLSELDPALLSLRLESSLARTATELQETAYQLRRRRLEDLGFQDYFDAIEIFTSWPADQPLPLKSREPAALSTLPMTVPGGDEKLLLLRALAALDPAGQQRLAEELFYCCNKLLAARRISAADGEGVRRGIREAVLTANLGLDAWSMSEPGRAAEGLRRHFLVSFYQYGRGRLAELADEARRRSAADPPEEGSAREAVIEGILADPPRRIEVVDGRLVEADFASAADLETARRQIY